MIITHAAPAWLRATPARATWAVALALTAAFVLSSCGTSSPSSSPPPSDSHGSSTTPAPTASSTSSSAASTKPAGPTKKVHVSSLEADGAVFGVGMPIVLRFTPAPKNSIAFTKAAMVTVNGKPANGAWFWEKPYKDSPIEAHYRTRGYWPANATIQLKLPIGGLSAGRGLVYDDKLTSVTFRTAAAHVSTVDGRTGDLKMTVTSNGKVVKTIPVSLGKAAEPTYNGTKIVMQKGEQRPGSDKPRPNGAVRMIGPGYNEIVDWSVRVTGSGEYVHAAPWNSRIGQTSTSNGCTNLSVSNAKWYYKFSRIGDVVTYANTGGKRMPSWDGYGDWNLPWPKWLQGGLLLNH